MEIKTKKQMNLSQLIEWIEINRKFNKSFRSDKYNYVHVTDDGIIEFAGEFYKDTFTVEVEEEITEDTALPKVIVVFKHNANLYTERLFSQSISEILKLDNKVKGSVTKTIYIMNNDGTFTLIWRDGKLIEE